MPRPNPILPSRTAALLLCALAPKPLPAQDFTDQEARWSSALERFHVPGLSVCAVQDGEVVYTGAFGVRDGAGNPVDEDTIFYIASTTKCFTGTAICMLADQGRLDLDQPVASVLPRFELASEEATRTVTLRDLLSHRRGLRGHPAIVFHDAYAGDITDDLFFRLLKTSLPEERFVYSNVHFTILGRVIEAREGMPWQDYLAQRIFEPLGMHRTSARVSTFAEDEDRAMGLAWDGEHFTELDVQKSDATMHAAGGMVTTASDLGRWILLHLGEGSSDGVDLLSPDAERAMQVLHAEEEDQRSVFHRRGMGLSWMLGDVDGVPMVGHNGGYVGFGCHLSFLPTDHAGVAVLINGEGAAAQAMIDLVAADVYSVLVGTAPPTKDWAALENRYRRPSSARPPPPLPVLVAAELDGGPGPYLGRYENPAWGTFEFEFADGELRARNGLLHSVLRRGPQGEISFELFPGEATSIEFLTEKGPEGELRILGFRTEAPSLEFEHVEARNGVPRESCP